MEYLIEFVTRKNCSHPYHDPQPRAMWHYKPGIYEHRCPNCVLRQWLIVLNETGMYRVVTPYPCCGVPEDIEGGE